MSAPEEPDVREQPGGRVDAPPLARSTLDRAAEHRTDDEWLAAAWGRGLVVVVDLSQGGRALVDDDRLVLLPSAEAPEGDHWFLGLDTDGTPLWMVAAPLPGGAEGATLRDIGHLLDARDAGVFTTAVALGNWHRSHTFSPRTGLPTTVVEAGWARKDTEGNMMWPRTDPAMIVLVHDGVSGPEGRCLLGHNATWGRAADGGLRFSCLAGYVEPGESAEASVAREVGEEVGLDLTSLHYAGSQSWPFPGSLMLGYHATADPEQPIRLDPAEIDEAHWFTRDEIAKMIAGDYHHPASGVPMGLPMPSSIAFYLIEQWLGGLAH